MKLIKTKGIVVKEVAYGDNDKIITLLTDKVGLVSCIAKGAKRSKSCLLASSQYLVYSEFILFRGTSFYHINQAEVINTFYSLKMDFDKLQNIYGMTKSIIHLTNENMDTEYILRLFLNSLHFMQNSDRSLEEIINIFRIKLVKNLGFMPQYNECSICKLDISTLKDNSCFYDYVSNIFICSNCNLKKTSRQIKIEYPCYMYIKYVASLDMKKSFSISLKSEYHESLRLFGQALIDCVCNST